MQINFIKKTITTHKKILFISSIAVLILCIILGSVYFFLYPRRVKVEIASDSTKSDIYKISGNQKIKISDFSGNHSDVFSRGDYIVWVEEPVDKSEKYIVIYHEPTEKYKRITTEGVAQKPKVDKYGSVVWQEWTNDIWEIYMFKDNVITKVSSTDVDSKKSSINPDVSGDKIIYATKNSSGEWETIEYSIESKTHKVISTGIEAKTPSFK